MTRDADAKKLVRERMALTGENYTKARAALFPDEDAESGPATAEALPEAREPGSTAFERARAEQRKVVGRFIGADGRMTQVPMKRKARAAVLLDLLARFEPGREYAEPEVNELLGTVHDDFAFWRRELVDYGFLERDGGRYRVVSEPPVRPASMRQEIPDWEALWLPGFLAGEHA